MVSKNRANVIVVEDDALSREALCACLESEGLTSIRSAANGAAALRLIKENSNVDVIVLDVYMPDMDGIEFLRELKQCGFQGGVILMSGDPVILKTSKGLGKMYGIDVWAALSKPFSAQSLMQVIEENLTPAQSQIPL